MNKRIFWVMMSLLIGMLPVAGQAAEFDGSKPFVCAIIDANECGVNGECRPVSVHDIDCPRFFNVNLSKKTVIGTMPDQSTREVTIQSSVHLDGNLILQGVQKGRAWSLIVTEDTGRMTLSVSGPDEGFVLFGESFIP